ncbi:putative ABC transport system ATP-binding protein [Agromyces terreus]|uniref:ABC transport system ATP-binding protein n=1 Tax=Agromyces terreus TaxID=424795 RepID=A0A9X2GXU6_9MICO|nr:ABC transporter ATP-binding protein [Agromyces terreus]MCP2369421.1 putative ABC transport system ATP-binding protein [Agromyces terreus]
MTTLRAENVGRDFETDAGAVHAVAEVSLEVRPGELLVITGPSGAGKTTLLNLLGGLDRPTSGCVRLGETDLSALGDDELAAMRREQLGYVFQSFGLIPVLSASENVEVPLRLLRMAPAERDARVTEALDAVGLGSHGAQRPYELSGGQQRRVGIARAIAARPRLLLADEPTGQLDSSTAATVMDLIGDLVHERGVAAVVTTHDPAVAGRADRILELHDGRVRSVSAPAPRGR